MSNVLNYTQFVLPIQNDGKWYRLTVGADAPEGMNFGTFLGLTRPFVDEISLQFNIARRQSRDLGYIVGRLWDEAGMKPSLNTVIMLQSRGYVDAFVEGMRDHLRERDGLGTPEVPVPRSTR